MSEAFFLWPMLVPMAIPLIYCIKYKKELLSEIGTITLAIALIVLLYWPLLTSNFLGEYTYVAVKVVLFIFFPLLLLLVFKRNSTPLQVNHYGIQSKGTKKSLLLCLLFLPIMLGITFGIKYFMGISGDAETVAGILSFFESFTEEFFFRGVLFLFLISKIDLRVAYLTSLASFVLMHPQNLESLFIISTIVQGILTLEICRRSKNLLGAWVLHGTNRLFSIALLPLLI